MKDARLFGALFALALLSPPAWSDEPAIRIATGNPDGTYHPVGELLCRVISASGIPCTIVATEGSVSNLAAIRDGQVEFALAQSDTQFFAYKGIGNGHGIEVNKRLRAVMSIYDEPYTLVVRRGAGIDQMQDAKGKRVNLGAPGSGERETNRKLMDRLGWRETDFASVAEVSYDVQTQLFCGGKLDAVPIIIGHPNRGVGELLSRCNGALVPVVSLSVHTLVKEFPYYTASTIHAGTYPQVTKDLPTFGVKATLVTSSGVPESLVYQVAKALFGHVEQLRGGHPALKWIDRKGMIEGNSAPFHTGALHYLHEANLLAPLKK